MKKLNQFKWCWWINLYVEKHEKIAREEEKERWINVLIENDVADEDISRSSGLSIDEILHYKKIAQKKF